MRRQKYFNSSVIIGFITFMNMFVPFSTDMYLPALPEMGNYFSAEQYLVSLTLTAFFLVFAVAIVIFGPLCDKYGRKNVLLFGSIIYTSGSLACVFAPNIYALIVARIIQAVGAGAIITVSTTLIKDLFRGELMKKILAITQALGVIAPIAAPIAGGFLLTITSWHGSFIVLSILGGINIIMSLLLTETLPAEKRYKGSVISSLTLLVDYCKRPSFMLLLIVFSSFSMPFFVYLSTSSFIYIEGFGLSAQDYSKFFAINAATSVLGPIIYLRVSYRFSKFTLTHICFSLAFIIGLSMFFFGHGSAIIFLMCFIPFSILSSLTRPFSMDWLLSQAKENVGTASATINFVQNFSASLGMLAGSLPWSDFINGLAFMIIGTTIFSFTIWQFAKKYY